jgi:hypothetical protein
VVIESQRPGIPTSGLRLRSGVAAVLQVDDELLGCLRQPYRIGHPHDSGEESFVIRNDPEPPTGLGVGVNEVSIEKVPSDLPVSAQPAMLGSNAGPANAE